MRVHLAAVGKLKDGAERELYERYAARFDAAGRAQSLGPLLITELSESRAQDAATRKADEAKRLMAAAATAECRIALAEAGKQMSSEELARFLALKRDQGIRAMAFLIGGPDGHGGAALEAATATLSLGRLTLTHGLARIVLCEQLYRAATILSGHPYHRA